MQYTILSTLLSLPLVALGQDNSALFSQYLGATTASANFAGPSASDLSFSLSLCTNFVQSLDPIPTELPASGFSQIAQVQVDGVCEFCTSVSQSRVDSCCGVSTSVDCFEKFKSGGSAGQTAPPAVSATTTPGSNPATATGGAPAAKSSSGAERVDVTNIAAPVLAILGFVRWFL